MRESLTAESLREKLAYDADSGIFVWRVARGRWKQYPAGERAGYPHPQGYVAIDVGGRHHLAHRLAWLWMTGARPTAVIDHIDRDKRNNAISNLRQCSQGQNRCNSTVSTRNKLGIKGVRVNCGAYEVRARLGGSQLITRCRSLPEAIAAYSALLKQVQGAFSRIDTSRFLV